MKLKTATLLAVIGVCLFLLCHLAYPIISFSGLSYEIAGPIYTVCQLFGVVSWVFILLFFITLYKNQK